jgi:RNA polymerase sigma factor (sigma-70 family)
MRTNDVGIDAADGPSGPGAFDVFFKEHFPTARRVLKAKYPFIDMGTIDELVQDAMVSVYEKNAKFISMSEDKRLAYFLIAVCNKAKNHLRRHGRESSLEEGAECPFRGADRWQEDLEVRDAFSRLPEELREVAALKWLTGLTAEEVAMVTRLSRRTVTLRLSKARRSLQDLRLIDGHRSQALATR